MKKRIAILGSTGSIGTQALQVIADNPTLFEAYAITAYNWYNIHFCDSVKLLWRNQPISSERERILPIDLRMI